MVYRWLEHIERWLYPPVCVLCDAPGQPPLLDLCAACEADLPRIERACPGCGRPFEPGSLCGACLAAAPAFDAACVPYRYAWPVDRMIHRFKYDGRLPFGRVLGRLLATAAAERGTALPGCLIPVPLHPRRLRERGFNQASELARAISRQLGLKNCSEACLRLRDTAEQSGLDARERRANLRNAFAVADRLPARHVAIVDDVLTTGTTAHLLARALKRAGARRVEIWAIARA